MIEPLDFTIGVRDFDPYLLPEDSREVGTEAFKQAVVAYYAEQFTPCGGQAIVAFAADAIHVEWVPDEIANDPLDYAISLLSDGKLDEGATLLRVLHSR